MGSVLGTIKDVVDALRAAGHRIGAVGITSFRPFPIDAVRNALQGATSGRRRGEGHQRRLRRGAVDRRGHGAHRAAGAGGHRGGGPGRSRRSPRPHSGASSRRHDEGELERLTFLDLNTGLVERELERMALHRRSGPTAENMLRDLGVIASGIG